MWYRLLADALLILHFLWIIFLILGLPVGLYFKMRRLRIVHAFGLLFALALQIGGMLCPLTIWEEKLRLHQQPDFSYGGSFIIAYIERLVYPGWISMNTLTVLTVMLVLLTLLSFILKPPWQKTASRSD